MPHMLTPCARMGRQAAPQPLLPGHVLCGPCDGCTARAAEKLMFSACPGAGVRSRVRRSGHAWRVTALVLGGSLGFAHALLQALGAAVTAAIQFFLALDLLVSHVFPPDGASPDNVSSPFTLFSEQSPALQPAARPLHALQTKKTRKLFF